MGVMYTYPCLSKNAVEAGLNLRLSVKLGRGKGCLAEQGGWKWKDLFFGERYCWKKWTRKQKQNNIAIEPRSCTIRWGKHFLHRNCTCEMTYPATTEVIWENRKGCFFGSLKLWLKILMDSQQPYVLSMFFIKTFYPLIIYSVWRENASSSDKCMWSENTFYWTKGFFPSFFFLFFFINWWRNCLT